MRVLGVIPGRFGSQRFPGKLLALLAGKTVIQRTYENASRSSLLSDLLIATDDERIRIHAITFGAKVEMTPLSCSSGTERIISLLKASPHYASYDVIVNIQGDEPALEPTALDHLLKALKASPEAVMATLISPLRSEEEWRSPSVVKCVCNRRGEALYFSRAPVPSSKGGGWSPDLPCFRHVGIYAYRTPFLLNYGELENTALQVAEDLEQLKVIEWGYRIATAVVEESALGVDTPEDLQTLERRLCSVSTSFSPAESVLR